MEPSNQLFSLDSCSKSSAVTNNSGTQENMVGAAVSREGLGAAVVVVGDPVKAVGDPVVGPVGA